jgi:peptide deformylase
MIRKLVTIPNSVLRMKSRRIGFVDDAIKDMASDMIQTTLDWDHDSEIGAALAAIQIGEPIKLTVVRNDFEDRKNIDFTTLVNPEVVKRSTDKVADIEGCLSVPGIYGRVLRYKKIKVKAQDLEGNDIRLTLEGFPARVLQHEIDHMDGVIFLDHIKSAKNLFAMDDSGKLSPLGDKQIVGDDVK